MVAVPGVAQCCWYFELQADLLGLTMKHTRSVDKQMLLLLHAV
jgi:hypothetical protein